MKAAIKAWLDANVDFDRDDFIGEDLIHYDKDSVVSLIHDCLDELRRSIEIEVAEDMATKCCPFSGFIMRNEQARHDLLDWAKTLKSSPPSS